MLRLYGNWRSLAAYRVRVGLHLKGFVFEQVSIDLAADEQLAPAYRLINPQAALPALLVDDGAPLTQSLAILEYLEERRPEPPLLPGDPETRAKARSLALLVAADHHPLVTPRVTRYLADRLAADANQVSQWTRHWFAESLGQAEARLASNRGSSRFCFGPAPSLADICLASQILGARAFGMDVGAFPRVAAIGEACFAVEAFARAHPFRQPDAPIRS